MNFAVIILATFFGSGKLKPAPGSWGSAAALLAAAALGYGFGQTAVLIAGVGLFVIGIYAAHRYGIITGIIDNGEIVIDEAAAVFLLVGIFPLDVPHLIAIFVLFRIFDIAKPPPIGSFDRCVKNGFGVMFDDMLAALYAGVVLFLGESLIDVRL